MKEKGMCRQYGMNDDAFGSLQGETQCNDFGRRHLCKRFVMCLLINFDTLMQRKNDRKSFLLQLKDYKKLLDVLKDGQVRIVFTLVLDRFENGTSDLSNLFLCLLRDAHFFHELKISLPRISAWDGRRFFKGGF